MDSKIVAECFAKTVPVNVRLQDGGQKRGLIRAVGGFGQNILATVECEDGCMVSPVQSRDLSLALGRV
jgi:hypothetical protein